MKKYAPIDIAQDIVLILFSIGFAYLLVKTGVLSQWLLRTEGLEEIGPFFAGLFFTSIFTTPPSVVVLGEMGQMYPIFQVAFFGAAGAVVGDLIIFHLVKDRFSEHLVQLFKIKKTKGRIAHLFQFPAVRWLTFLVGGLLIASPLPDELGIGLLGISKMKASGFITISFIFNFIGIALVCLAARALA